MSLPTPDAKQQIKCQHTRLGPQAMLLTKRRANDQPIRHPTHHLHDILVHQNAPPVSRSIDFESEIEFREGVIHLVYERRKEMPQIPSESVSNYGDVVSGSFEHRRDSVFNLKELDISVQGQITTIRQL